jgi:hypothetical protein
MHTIIEMETHLLSFAVAGLAAYATTGISLLLPISIAADLLPPLLSFCDQSVVPLDVSLVFFLGGPLH